MADEQYLVLARKWRPQSFEDVVGQLHITRTLQNAITSRRVGHAYLFIGSRGIGKTTTARVLAKAMNCLAVDAPTPDPCNACENCTSIAAGTNLDVIEIDGASNNSVEDVRQIRENIRLTPAASRYKIYIIDEVHQLSAAAFNALLKTLEEPPAHGVFILATTEAHKVPATIISRCQRHDFRRPGMDDTCALLRRIVEEEGIACTDEALHAVARAADGGIRDAESILEQLISYCGKEISFQDVFDVLGLVDWQVLHNLCDGLFAKDVGVQLQIVEDVVVSGKDLSQFVQEILRYLRNLLVCKTADAESLLALPPEEIAAMQERAQKLSLTNLIRLVEQFSELSKDFDSQLAQRIALEALLIRVSKVAVEVSVDSVLEKLLQLEQGGADRPFVPTPPKTAAPKPEPAPAPPKPRRTKPALDEDNLRELWGDLLECISHEEVRLNVRLGQATPSHVDGDSLVITFAEHNRAACDFVMENRSGVEALLRERTSNITSLRAELVEAEGPPADDGVSTPVESSHVLADDERAALDDPHIAKVVDVFKGRICQVRHNVKPPSGT